MYSSARLPFLVFFDQVAKTHSFHLLKIDQDTHRNIKASLNFEREIQLISSAEEQDFMSKLQSLDSELTTLEIHREPQREEASQRIEVLDVVYNSRNQNKKQFCVYCLGKDTGNGSQLKVFLLAFVGLLDSQGHLVLKQHMKKLRVFEGVSTVQPFKCFDVDTHQKVFWKRKLFVRSCLSTTTNDVHTAQHANADKQQPKKDTSEEALFRHVQRKSIKALFKTRIGYDGLLVLFNKEYFSMLFEDVLVSQMRLPDLTGGTHFDEFFEVTSPLLIKSRVLQTTLKARTCSHPISVCFVIPMFSEDLILLTLEIVKQTIDRRFFWSFLKDLWNFLFAGTDSPSTDASTEFDMFINYFTCVSAGRRISLWLEENGNERDTSSKTLGPKSNAVKRFESLDSFQNDFVDFGFHFLFKSQISKFEAKRKTKKEDFGKPKNEEFGRNESCEKRGQESLNCSPTLANPLIRSRVRELFGKVRLSLDEFDDIKVGLFKTLHLLNEEFRLSVSFSQLNVRLSYLLMVFASFLESPAAESYRNHYLNLFPQIVMFLKRHDLVQAVQWLARSASTSLQSIPNLTQCPSPDSLDHLSPEVFDVIGFLDEVFQSRLSPSQIKQMVSRHPFLFRNSYRVIKVILLLFGQPMSTDCFGDSDEKSRPVDSTPEPSPTAPFLWVFQSVSDSNRFQVWRTRKMLKEFQLAQTKARNFNSIFLFMLREKMSFAYIESLIDSLVYFYKSVLRLLRKEISDFLIEGHFPKSAYKLLMREDLFANKFLHPSQHIRSLNTGNFSANFAKPNRAKKHSDISLQAGLAHQPLDFSGNRISTFLCNFQEEHKAPNETSAVRHKQGHSTDLTFDGTGSPQAVENQAHQIALLERELNMSCQSYSTNLHVSRNDPSLVEVYKLFNCSEVMLVNKKNYEKISNYEEFDEDKLGNALNSSIHNQVCQRLSSFVGKGAVDLGTEGVSVTDYVNIPAICTTGRIKEKERNFSYLFNLENQTDKSQMNWAEFHNGVSAALSISKKSLSKIDKEGLRTWIEYQKTDLQRYDHAGLVYGLGLQGVLDCFTIADIYFNLKGGIDARIIGTILGLAIFKNDNFHYMIEETKQKAFCLLLEVNMSDNSNVQINRIVQAASMIGNGIYNKASCKKTLIETMLREIEARPLNENNNNRECHSLSAGFALGLISLGKGSNVSSTKDLQIDEALFNLIVDESKGSIFDKNREAQLQKQRNNANGSKKAYFASNVKEPLEGNGLLTTPSALIALALVNLKTNNAIVSSRLELPNTIYEVINGNPLHILLKVVARHLIMWRDIEASEAFVQRSIPESVRFLFEKPFHELAKLNLNNRNFDNIDFHNLTVIYFNIIAGTLLALALKYAGTGDETIKAMVFANIRKIRSLEIIKNEFSISFSNKNKIDAYSYFSLLSFLSLVLGILMAGRCDTESKSMVYAVIRRLKNYENDPESVPLSGIFGFFMALQMAMGFLFLGNGSLSFGNDNFQIACLLMAVYPVFPSDFNDNKYHLQALRHFYVLATEEK